MHSFRTYESRVLVSWEDALKEFPYYFPGTFARQITKNKNKNIACRRVQKIVIDAIPL